MLKQIKAMLEDEQLRQKIKEAKTQDEAIKLLTTAAGEKGEDFATENVTKLLNYVALQTILEMSEEDLLAVAGRGCRLSDCGWWTNCPNPPITYY